jgi:prephenate dehydrogenase
MSDVLFQEIAIIGTGLLGGSIGLAVKSRAIAAKVIGIGRNPERLDLAKRMGAVDSFTTDLGEGCREADLIVLALPVKKNIDVLEPVARAAKPGALVTDVGSTKTAIMEHMQRYFGKQTVFIGSHPMAGSEKSGIEHARADLYCNAICYITVIPSTPAEAMRRLAEFWQAIGSRPVIVRPERHDRLVAALSHLPHFTAVALAKTVQGSDDDTNLLKSLAGNGFLGTTRIAEGHPQMWSDIAFDNQQNLCCYLEGIVDNLQQIKQMIANNDVESLTRLLSSVRRFRQEFNP